jgi:hypothetical protein
MLQFIEEGLGEHHVKIIGSRKIVQNERKKG